MRQQRAHWSLVALLLLCGCELWDAPMPDPDCGSTNIDAGTELMISAQWLREDPRAKNADAGAFSFAGQLAQLERRYASFDAGALWDIVDSADDATPPARQPFRLLALVNRTDLAEQLGPDSPAGEARLVFTLTNGAGDDASSTALPLTVIFEYALGSERSVADWARAFHALGSAGAAAPQARADAAYQLVESVTAGRGAATGPRLSQVRVNDARAGVSELYELALDATGRLQQRGLRNTPRTTLAGTPELAAFLRDNVGAVTLGTHRVPTSWLADSASLEEVEWLPGAPRLERDFSRGTCGGCHGSDGPTNNGFHLSESPQGAIELSPFVTDEDLPRRAQVMRAHLCAD